jgi:predicted nuclease of predicted toxin-antitoxin system
LQFDQNLSPSLVSRFADVFPDSSHVSLLSLDRASDEAVWQFARDNDFSLVSKDAGFSDLSLLRSHTTLGGWLRLGNCATAQVECSATAIPGNHRANGERSCRRHSRSVLTEPPYVFSP